MACFLVPGGEAIVATALRSVVKKKEIEAGVIDAQGNQIANPAQHGVCWTRKLTWLATMLWGGVLVLVIDHIFAGEIVPYAPFLTAMNSPEEFSAMLGEVATVGVCMSLCVTALWFAICVAADLKAKYASKLFSSKSA